MTLAVLSRSLSSSVDVRAMCGQVLDEVMLATSADTGLLVLLDDFATTPQIGAARGLPDENDQYAEVVAALKKIDPARGAYIVRRDTHLASLPPFLTPEAHSMLIVPMVQSSFLFGAIWLESTSNAIFDSEHIRFVEQISNQAVIALENADYFSGGRRPRTLARLLDTMVEGIMMIDPRRCCAGESSHEYRGLPAEACLTRISLLFSKAAVLILRGGLVSTRSKMRHVL